ncbi:Acetyl esterase/lipase [Sanguibacter gelidistatuariae]|uniref:Acetyl esterase/lipase n=1 Tax=Sanguibacter gelidistatuariae TaxID=1814289 RepID=A0A1G6P399_9MICO|nr:alpha/beta hydrolase [Sanguibacter gelidistatuariae]SDC74539.1 Acetyl esterase/lipase [Sanguibacter gelidistatuariae]
MTSLNIDRAPLTVLPAPDPGAGGRSRGFVLVLAGGGYVGRAEHEYLDVTAWLAANGVACAYLDYAVAPATYPVALGQVLRAVAELRSGEHGPVDGPIAVLGFSAGAHLAGLALTATDAELTLAAQGLDRPTRPDAGVLCYPVVSMTDLPHLGSRGNLLGARADDTAYAKALSVERRVDLRTPPTFLWHTADDAVVDVEHSLRLAGALGRAHIPYELHVYPTGSHGLGLAETAGAPAEWTQACLRWLGEQGIGPAQGEQMTRSGETT